MQEEEMNFKQKSEIDKVMDIDQKMKKE